MAEFPTFIGGAFASASPVADAEQTINWFVEVFESPGATTRTALYPTPGFASFTTLAASGARALFSAAGRTFAVYDATLYEVAEDGTVTSRGTVAVDDNPATICTNGDGGNQLFITSGTNGYCYDLSTNTLTQITNLNGKATQGGQLYGYFVAFDAATSTIYLSDLFDGLTWDPTQFAQRTIGSDPWTAMHVTPYGYIALLGSKTSEFWYNAGTFPFPFAPDPSALIEEGIAATFSVRQAGKAAVWLSQNANGGYQVMKASGFSPERISTQALEDAIAGYTDAESALGETYEDGGHAFYLLSFPRSGATWCFDFKTGLWARRGTWIAEESRWDYLRPCWHTFNWGQHFMADRGSNVLYRMSTEIGTDIEDRPLRRVRVSPATQSEHRMLAFDSFELLMQTGVGLTSGATEDTDPQIMLRVSNDFGQTWGREKQASVGAYGEFGKRVRWRMLGRGRGRVYEVSVTAAVPWRISAAYQTVRLLEEAA